MGWRYCFGCDWCVVGALWSEWCLFGFEDGENAPLLKYDALSVMRCDESGEFSLKLILIHL